MRSHENAANSMAQSSMGPGQAAQQSSQQHAQSSIPPMASPLSRQGPRNVPRQACLSVSFNQTHDCFMVGSQNGFRIYTYGTGNPEVISHIDRDLNGGITNAEMVNKTNIMALVGGGDSPKWPTNKLMIWDDLK